MSKINKIQLSGTVYDIQDLDVTKKADTSAVTEALSAKQDTLVSGSNIKTINNQTILGSGNITIQGGTVDTELDETSENPVQNKVIYAKIDEVEEVTAAALNVLNDNFGGLKLQQISQSAYDALTTKDSSTLYVIVN